MMTVTCFCAVVLLLHGTTLTSAVLPEIALPDPVNGLAGDDLILSCYLKNNVSAVDMEVQWLINGNSLVHHYKGHEDLTDQQIPEYRNRTSLFRDELLKGNISLKLTQVRLSDTNTYRCLVRADGGSDEKSFDVSIVGKPLRHHYLLIPVVLALLVVVCILILRYRQTHEESFLMRSSSFTLLDNTDSPENIPTAPCRGSQCLLQYKNWIKTNLREVLEYSQDGKSVSLDDQYIKLDIAKVNSQQIQRDSDHGNIECAKFSADELFSPDAAPVPTAVVLKGQCGHGKSITAQKVIKDWASGVLYSEQFELVVLLKCEELNEKHSSSSTSLVDLVSPAAEFRPLFEETLKKSPHRVLFIIDGFDELRPLADGNGVPLPSQPFMRTQSITSLYALISGDMLPESFLLITTRPTASEKLCKLISKRQRCFTEILEFSSEKVKEYFEKFFKEKQNFERAYQCVRMNEMLFSSCCIPVICWIVCTVLRDGADTIEKLQTTTSIFVHVVHTLLKRHVDGESDQDNLLRSLCKLAEKGTLERKVLFSETEIYDVMSTNNRNPFLWKLNRQRKYSFFHQSFQGFFTGLHYIMMDNAEAWDKVDVLLTSLQGESLRENSQLRSVIQFLFGLSNVKMSGREMLTGSGNTPITSEPNHKHSFSVTTQLKNWLCAQVTKSETSEVASEITCFFLHCLYELQDMQFVKNAIEHVESIDLSHCHIKKRDCFILRYCLQCCPRIRRLTLKNCKLTPEKLKLLHCILPTLHCDYLRLDVEGMDDAGALAATLSLSEDSDQTSCSEVTETRQKFVHIRFIAMRSISITTATRIINTVHKSTMCLEIHFEVEKQPVSNGKSCCSSFSVQKDDNRFLLTMAHQTCMDDEIPPVSHITLTLLPLCNNFSPDWSTFLDMFHKMSRRKLSETHSGDENEDTLNEENLLSFLNSLSGLLKVELEVRFLTEFWADRILSLLKSFSSQQDIKEDLLRIWSAVSDQNGNSLCSSLSFSKDVHNYRMTAVHKSQEDKKGLALISITTPQSPCPIKWITFLRMFQLMDSAVDKTAVDQNLMNLLTVLSDVREIELKVGCLTETWFTRVLTFVQTYPSEENLSVCVESQADEEDNLCSVLSLEKDRASFRLTADDRRVCSNQDSAPPLSHISVLVHSDTQMDWVDFLSAFHSLSQCTNRRELQVNDPLKALQTSLCALGGLKEVKMWISCFNKMWARWILFLMSECLSLQKITLSTGLNAVCGDEIGWIERGQLHVKGIEILKDSEKREDCVITLIGIKTSTLQRKGYCRLIEITINGSDCSERHL